MKPSMKRKISTLLAAAMLLLATLACELSIPPHECGDGAICSGTISIGE